MPDQRVADRTAVDHDRRVMGKRFVDKALPFGTNFGAVPMDGGLEGRTLGGPDRFAIGP